MSFIKKSEHNRLQKLLLPGFFGALIIAILVIGLIMPPTTGSFVASISNTQNTLKTRKVTNCQKALLDSAAAGGGFQVMNFGYQSTSWDENLVSNNLYDFGNYGYRVYGDGPCKNPRNVFQRINKVGDYIYQSKYTKRYMKENTSFSLETWFRTSNPGGALVGLYGRSSPTLSTYGSTVVQIGTDGSLTFSTSKTQTNEGPFNILTAPGANVGDGQWHQVVATWNTNSRQMELYLDGDLLTTGVGSHPIGQHRYSVIRYGCQYNNRVPGYTATNKNCFLGDLAWGANYERVLSPEEIKEHWDSRQY
ncbi:LamG-like jellyroll fold domain-containing protein [Corynebacterium caspium]|uniref:LamG-like jellyroll fold domain-containing protein n=1 Tax=Corynebacterium caspium TaxID=234828 RepID=UPI00037B1A12|nr:LamG-like jellyroll fold domain-containing protein [Corynebacterium caspium]WKD58849.1 hypothetical protein CCASP_02205 [Corynebacterium caspium DSM 44850]